MNQKLWSYLFTQYPDIENDMINKDTLCKIIELVYDFAYNDGYFNRLDNNFNYCCEVKVLESDDD